MHVYDRLILSAEIIPSDKEHLKFEMFNDSALMSFYVFFFLYVLWRFSQKKLMCKERMQYDERLVNAYFSASTYFKN